MKIEGAKGFFNFASAVHSLPNTVHEYMEQNGLSSKVYLLLTYSYSVAIYTMEEHRLWLQLAVKLSGAII